MVWVGLRTQGLRITPPPFPTPAVRVASNTLQPCLLSSRHGTLVTCWAQVSHPVDTVVNRTSGEVTNKYVNQARSKTMAYIQLGLIGVFILWVSQRISNLSKSTEGGVGERGYTVRLVFSVQRADRITLVKNFP